MKTSTRNREVKLSEMEVKSELLIRLLCLSSVEIVTPSTVFDRL